jgi:superfamily II DNA or RNA helicase
MVISHPTGVGKTVTFSTVARGAAQKGRRVLVLAHRDELIKQATDKILLTAPELDGNIGVVKAQLDEAQHAVTVASVQSLHPRRLERLIGAWGDWDVVIVDECHHSAAVSYQRILGTAGCMDEGTNVLTLGVTATPQRADSKDLGEIWQEIVHHMSIISAMQQGYLCDVRGLQVQLAALDMSNVRVSRGDFVDSDTADQLMEADAPRHVLGAWRTHASDRRTIVFTPTIDLAREMARTYREAGISARHLSGETPMEERRQLLRDFSSGEVQVVANAQVLTEGFDEPQVDCIVVARPTRSQVLYSQMIGRGLRPYPGKADCLVLDTVGATERLDLQTVPKLFGLGEEVAQANADPTQPQQTVMELQGLREARQVRDGRIVARQVEMFDRQKLAWNLVRPGAWALQLQNEMLLLQVDGETNTWGFYTVNMEQRRAPRMLQQDGLDLGYAMGAAEDYARSSANYVNKLVSRSAGWRSADITEGQITALRKFGHPPTTLAGLSRGEASDLLTQSIARSRA